MFRIDRRSMLTGLAAGLAAPRIARAAWPDKTMTIVHGFAAGGNADIVSRIFADALTRKFGTQFVVEPRPGAGGSIAAGYVARARPDGGVIAVLPGGHPVSAAIYKRLSFDPVNDFTWLTLMTDYPFILATYNDHPIKHISDLVPYAKQASDPLLWASVGIGSGQHMSGELLASMAQIPMKHVPYKGEQEGMLDLIGKRLDLIFDTLTVLLEPARIGQLRALAVTGAQRFFALPDAPSIGEAVPGYETSSWLGMAAPPGLPAEIAAPVTQAVHEILAEPEIVAKLRALGSVAAPTTGAELKNRVVAEIAKWSKVVEQSKIERL